MVRRATATPESIIAAVEALVTEGLEPTTERVRAKLGGGSFTTINKILSGVLEQRQTEAAQANQLPAELVEIGQRAVVAIYAAVNRASATKIDLIEADARKQIDAAKHARAEAALEIERLERLAEQAAENLATAERSITEADTRAQRAEATVAAQAAELSRLPTALAAARDSERATQLELSNLKSRLTKIEANAEHAQSELKKLREELDKARASERSARDEAAELRGQLRAKK